MQRILEPEWLDHMSPADPVAIASRADLRRLNALLRHVARMRKILRQSFPSAPPKRIIELGTGDGSFMLKLLQERDWKTTELILVDRQAAISAETRTALEMRVAHLQLVQADIFAWLPTAPEADFMMANMFLHHFHPGALRQLFALASERAGIFAAGEPRRYLPSLVVSSCLGLIGCNKVTRHDAVLSVKSGFNRQELSELWPKGSWEITEQGTLSSHWFVARKNS